MASEMSASKEQEAPEREVKAVLIRLFGGTEIMRLTIKRDNLTNKRRFLVQASTIKLAS